MHGYSCRSLTAVTVMAANNNGLLVLFFFGTSSKNFVRLSLVKLDGMVIMARFSKLNQITDVYNSRNYFQER